MKVYLNDTIRFKNSELRVTHIVYGRENADGIRACTRVRAGKYWFEIECLTQAQYGYWTANYAMEHVS